MHTKHLITNWVFLGAGFNTDNIMRSDWGGTRVCMNVWVCLCVREKERKRVMRCDEKAKSAPSL